MVSEEEGRLATPSWFLMDSTAENAESVRSLAGRDLAFSIACMGHGDALSRDGSAVDAGRIPERPGLTAREFGLTLRTDEVHAVVARDCLHVLVTTLGTLLGYPDVT